MTASSSVHKEEPLLVELFRSARVESENFPFYFYAQNKGMKKQYSIYHLLNQKEIKILREVVAEISENLEPKEIVPLTFDNLVNHLRSEAARILSTKEVRNHEVLSDLCSYEAIGLSRIYALTRDTNVTEIYADSEYTPVYIDNSLHGRCETDIVLTEREVEAIKTHMDTFGGYTLDYRTPSLKQDIELSGVRLRVTLDLEPLAVNRFLLDIRRLNIQELSIRELIRRGSITVEAACFLLSWLELGGNITIIGETGTGKTTLLNALDREMNPMLRRVYIEDAVETLDLLEHGYKQVKLKVDPYEITEQRRTKEFESVKILHRSPDLLILSEIQTKEHSKAFFGALTAGVRGIQTFHASSPEQAIKRWLTSHGIEKESILELGLIVLMQRKDRLSARREVSRISQVVDINDEIVVRDIFARDRDGKLRKLESIASFRLPNQRTEEEFSLKQSEFTRKLGVLIA